MVLGLGRCDLETLLRGVVEKGNGGSSAQRDENLFAMLPMGMSNPVRMFIWIMVFALIKSLALALRTARR